MIATVVDTAKLLNVVLGALAAGVGVTTVFSLAVLGAARYGDARRADRAGAAALYAALTLVGLAACATAIAYGIILLGRK